jgi:flagellar biogenesis protein FliO
MVYRISALVLTLAIAALPLRAYQEDEMGRLVDPTSTFSREVVSQVQVEKRDSGSTLLINLGIGLAGMMAVGGLALWWGSSNPRLRKLIAAFGPLKLISRMRLGVRHEVILLKVGERVLLVGAGPHGLNTLAEFTDPAEIARLTENPSASINAPAVTATQVEAPAVTAPAPEPVNAVEPSPASQPRVSPVRAELAKLAETAA